jgi:AcrR family transcriptional regulator
VTAETDRADGRLARGARTRAAVLDAAVALASEAGLDGLSLGMLAERLGVSKSGLFAHWPDKEILQLAVIEQAVRQWTEEVVTPALSAPRGIRRLWALHERRLAFYAAGTLPGRCFFVATEAEFDDRPGPVRDALADAIGDWYRLIRTVAAQAVELGELRADTDISQLAFEIQALGEAAVTTSRLLQTEQGTAFSRRAVLSRLRALSPTPELLTEE